MKSIILLAGCGIAPPAAIEVKVPLYVPRATSLPARPDCGFGKLDLAARAEIRG